MAEAGCRVVQVPAPHLDGTLSMLVLYPTDADAEPLRLGPFTLDVAANASPARGPAPVVVVSHGSGGSHLTHRGLGIHLARRELRVMAGQDTEFMGEAWADQKATIGYVPQEPRLTPNKTVMENIEEVVEMVKKIEPVLDLVDDLL